jgi:hypothetical protein
MDGTKFFAWGPGQRSYPLAVASRPGAGRVVYFAAPLDAVFLRDGHDEAATLLSSAVLWASAGKLSQPGGALPSVDVEVFEPDELTSVVVVASRATNNMYSIGNAHHQNGFAPSTRAQYARFNVPVADTHVWLPRGDWAADKSVSVQSLTGCPVGVESSEAGITLTLPVVDAYEVVRVSWVG